jgi:hypothetical protein
MEENNFVQPGRKTSRASKYFQRTMGAVGGFALAYGLGAANVYKETSSRLESGETRVAIERNISDRNNNVFDKVATDAFFPVRNLTYQFHQTGNGEVLEDISDIDGL